MNSTEHVPKKSWPLLARTRIEEAIHLLNEGNANSASAHSERNYILEGLRRELGDGEMSQ